MKTKLAMPSQAAINFNKGTMDMRKEGKKVSGNTQSTKEGRVTQQGKKKKTTAAQGNTREKKEVNTNSPAKTQKRKENRPAKSPQAAKDSSKGAVDICKEGKEVSDNAPSTKEGFIKRLRTILHGFFMSKSSPAQSPVVYAPSNLTGADYDEINKKIEEYWENTIRKNMDLRELTLTGISSEKDLAKPQNDTVCLNFISKGRFKILKINNDTLTGRISSKIVVKRTIIKGKETYNVFPDDQKDNIILSVSDGNSENLLEAQIKYRITERYNGAPMDPKPKTFHSDLFPYENCYDVVTVINNDTIKYLQVTYERVPDKQPSGKIVIIQAPWTYKGCNEVSTFPFPSDKQIRTDARNKLFKHFRKEFKKNSTGKRVLQITSGIRSNTLSKEPLKATEEYITLAIEFNYRLGKFPLGWQNYDSATAEITYKKVPREKKLKYVGIDDIRY